MPSWTCYYKDGDCNALRFDFGEFTFWWSYKELIAFKMPGHSRIVSENVWSVTTGKHLNKIDSNLKNRVNRETFERLAAQIPVVP